MLRSFAHFDHEMAWLRSVRRSAGWILMTVKLDPRLAKENSENQPQ